MNEAAVRFPESLLDWHVAVVVIGAVHLIALIKLRNLDRRQSMRVLLVRLVALLAGIAAVAGVQAFGIGTVGLSAYLVMTAGAVSSAAAAELFEFASLRVKFDLPAVLCQILMFATCCGCGTFLDIALE